MSLVHIRSSAGMFLRRTSYVILVLPYVITVLLRYQLLFMIMPMSACPMFASVLILSGAVLKGK